MAPPPFSPPDPSSPSGEMSARVKAFAWSKTPLGPPELWPQSLRIAVAICLGSRFPMFVWWGDDLINIYNDAYAPFLGARHPAALGRSAPAVWGDIWDVVGPQAEAVMRRGEATWNERVPLTMQRHGYTEQTYFTWSYSPIRDESGAIGGLFCACTEETQHVAAERERDRLLAQVESERARLAEAFAQSPSFLAIMRGPQLVFEFVNERYRQLISPRELIGRTVREALPEIEGQGFFEILDRVYASGEPYVGTGVRMLLQRHPDRLPEETFLDFVYQPLRDATGAVAGILADGIDVTARHRAEARDRFLVSLEDTLRALSDPDEITAAGARLLGEHLKADRCAYAEVEADEDTFNLIGDYNRGVPSIVGRYRFADFGAEVLALMRAGRPYVASDVETHQPPVGDLASYRKTLIRAVICAPLLKGGRLVAAMAVHQATPREWTAAQAELLQHVASRCYESIERARVERTLRESEWRFRQLADAMPQIVFAAQPDGRVDYFNRQWYEYTGLPEGKAGFDSWKSVHTEEGLARVLQAWPRSIATGEAYEIEYPLRRHDGQYRWHLGRALPIRDARGRVVRWFGTNTDIHDRKQIEDALARSLQAEQRARSEAELASRMKDEFLATLGHELRTPLNAILGWSHILRRAGAPEKEVQKGADVIERNARAQATIIEDLLDMSAIISGKVRLQMQPVDLPALVRAAVETARPTAEAKRIRMHLEIDALRDARIQGDPSRLQQVLWNLLTNAIKFTPANGHIEVSLTRAPVNSHVEIAVADSGEGIRPEFLPFVFDRFRQADASSTRRHGGLGLGLSISKQLVELHGGWIVAASAGEGRGTTMVVGLPAGAAPVEAPPEPRPGISRGGAPVTIRGEDCEAVAGKRLLVVDDDEDARELVRRLLEDCGATVVTASSSGEALRLAREQRFDVLVSDIGMPGEDGLVLMRRLRLHDADQNGDIPAVALTAYARPEDRAKAIRAGFQMHAAKPVEPAELVAMVASLAKRP